MLIDNDCAIFIEIPGLFKRQRLKTCSLRCTCSGTDGSLTALKPVRTHLQLSTDDKKIIYCYKTLAYSDDQRNQVFVCSRHYIRMPNVFIQRYVNSMRRRILLSICNNGGHTGYR